MQIDRYISTLRQQLTLPTGQAAEVAEEVEGHLCDAAHDLQMHGYSPAESERLAVQRFGTIEEIAPGLATSRRARRYGARSGLLALVAAAAIALLAPAIASAYTTPAPAQYPATVPTPFHSTHAQAFAPR